MDPAPLPASPHRGGAFPDALAALARHFPSGTFSTDRYREFLLALFERTTSLATWE